MKIFPKFKHLPKVAIISLISILSISALSCGIYFVQNYLALFENAQEVTIYSTENSYSTENIADEVRNEESIVETENENTLIPLGNVFGIKLYTDGVIVSSLQTINANGFNCCPAQDCGIEPGDYIISVEGIKIENNEHFSQLLSTYLSDEILLEIKRGDEIFETSITPVFDGEYYRLGMWIKDSSAGIGTLTYYDPSTGLFAGLGHGICETDTNELMTLKGGVPAEISISYIEKASDTETGKICGYFSSEESLGTLFANTDTGIYGELDEIPTGEAIPIGTKEEVEVGTAQILCTVENNETQYYDIEITKINSTSASTKNFTIKITDEVLLEITGGIIQGMSGSPIIQNGKIIGAVTHVFVNDSTTGYGIFIENMLETAESIE